jgi:CBS-domain-containing membrane protein
MREDEIDKAVSFLRSDAVKTVPVDQRKKFLEDKLTEEEISEVMKRFSKLEEQRLKQTNSHFVINAINITSLAVLTSIGVNYMLD